MSLAGPTKLFRMYTNLLLDSKVGSILEKQLREVTRDKDRRSS